MLDDHDIEEELGKVHLNCHESDEELKEEEVVGANFDKPLYKRVPQSEAEYLAILKERFGHNSFKEGQLEALKILLEKKDNALVVLATGGGKSLVYQYMSMFVPGLILVITPLISLMTDQL